MKRTLFVLLVIGSMLVASIAMAANPKTLRMALGDPENSEMGIVGNTFKKYVEEHSKGAIKVQLFFSGALGDETETIHNVRKGN